MRTTIPNIWLAMWVFLLAMACTAAGQIIYVDDDGPADFDNIQAAIADANDGDTVEIKPGTYTGDGNRDIDFLGKAITVRSIDPCNSDVVAATIIDCQGSKSEPHRGFKFVSSEETDSVLAGLTITNGYAPRDMSWDPTMVPVGGAILCDGSSPTISYCTIANNWSNWSGGGIFCRDSSLTISQCSVINNTANFYGGGIFCYRGNPTIIYSTISGNMAEQFSGGGIYCHYDTTPTIRHCVITGNSTGGYAGGVHYRGGNLTIQHCTIASNSADNYTGGGIHCWENCNLLVSHCILWDNTSKNDSQISLGNKCDMYVCYSDLQEGQAAIYVEDSTFEWGEGNIDADPCFVAPGYWVDVSEPNIPVEPNDPNAVWIDGDYHLQSQAGRWDPNSQTWGTDANTSPCIDAGDSNSDWTAELWPHGGCINMGAYGGTPEASMSLSDAGNIADLNIEGSVDYRDMVVFTEKWLYEAVLLAEDLNRDGFVNFTDFAIFADNWRRPPGQASNPHPYNRATGVDLTADLSWTAGANATSHDVYFGTSSSPPFIRNQTAKTFDPGTMTISTTYYWRIDEVNAWGKTTGTLWYFTTTTGPPPL